MRGILGINAKGDYRAQRKRNGVNTAFSRARKSQGEDIQGRNRQERNRQEGKKSFVDMDDDEAEKQLLEFLNEDDNQNTVQNSIPNLNAQDQKMNAKWSSNTIPNPLDYKPNHAAPNPLNFRPNFAAPPLNYRPHYGEAFPQYQNYGGREGGEAYKRPNYAALYPNYNTPNYGPHSNKNAFQNFEMRLHGRDINRMRPDKNDNTGNKGRLKKT